jgi:hypothetical protein
LALYTKQTNILSLRSSLNVKDQVSHTYKTTGKIIVIVFENRVLRRIFGPKREEVTGEWRKLHNEELNDLYSTPSIIRLIKSRRTRWAGHVASKGREGMSTGF